ncbi:MAG TPA: SDR family NAD(P)-dependent oxidoreductase [Stellaceae bacterium]|nr:SDR family NAD(P)-dependent oxidoreductase [Stellaceae bacterium]
MATKSNKRGLRPQFPVAVVGMSCRVPGANSIEGFWELLRTGTDAITDIPPERWDVDYYYHPDPAHPGRSYARAGGFIKDIDAFDANFFGISPREARQMDPQHRILLELTWEALENADIVPATLAGSDTGVFIGAASTDYGVLQRAAIETLTDPYGVSGSASSITANRISHFFDLSGPSIAIDTACSSALVSVHEACESLWSGETQLAVAGGINLILLPESMVGFAKAGMLSPTGRCHAFDADADGYVRSEGGGVVILKPLPAALADGNPIHAVLLGSAVNSDGRTKGIALPNPVAQEKLLRRVYSRSGIDPTKVDYVEAHGTGTNAGDRVECAALGRVFGASRPPGQPCRIGSVKTNVGHLEPASGIVGLLKGILTLKHRAIPPTVHFRRPNPRIPFQDLNLTVVAELTPLPQEGPLFAGVNSFGFGGTNAHVVLSSHEPTNATVTPPAPVPRETAPLFLSARSGGALKEMAQAYAQLLRSPDAPPLGVICSATALRRSHHAFRIATFGADAEEVASRLEAFAGEQPTLMLAESEARYQESRLAFVFSGNGSQWVGMGRDLLAQEPVFAEFARQIDAMLRPLVGWSLLEVLQSDQSDLYDKTEIAQPALFAMQVGIVELLRRRGITAEAMVGHSVGEIAAAYASGALSLEQACRVIACRSQAQGRTAGAGTMAAVGLGENQAREAIAAFDGALTLATINSPNSVTLAGEQSALEALRRMLKPRGVYCRLLGLDYAFHSAAMDSIRHEILDGLADLKPHPGAHRFISGVTGVDQDGAGLDAAYWWDNIRKPVQFAKAIQHLAGSGIDVFVEIGPHPILAGYLRECFESRSGNGTVTIPTLRRGEAEREALWMTVARCYTAGIRLDYAAMLPAVSGWVPLPPYPWQRERYWYGRVERVSMPHFGSRLHPLLGYRMPTGDLVWRNQLDPVKLSYLADHVVQGSAVFPASGYVELALAAAALHLDAEALELEELEIRRPLLLGGRTGPWVEFDLAADELSFRVLHQDKADSQQPPIAVGRLGALAADTPRPSLALEELQGRLATRIDAKEHYLRCAAHGLAYGPQFQGVGEMWVGPREALARIEVPQAIAQSLDEYRFHPVLLDACLQSVAGAVAAEAPDEDGVAFVPTRIDRLHLFGRGRQAAWCHVTVSRADRSAIVADLAIFDRDGAAVGDLAGVRFRRLGTAKSGEIPAWHWELHLQPGRWSGGSAADLPGVLDLAGALRGEVEAMARRAEQASAAHEVAPALEQLAALYARRALRRIGLDETPKPVAALMERGRIEPEFGRYLEALLRLSESRGLASELAGAWSATGQMAEGAPEALWRSILAKHPDWLASLELIARCGEQVLAVLAGEVDAEPILSPERDFDAGEQLRDSDPWFRIGNEIAAEVVSRVGTATLADRPLRIVEVGGGSGGLTATVLALLPAGRVDYLFTDPSEAAVNRAQGRFGEHGFMRFAVLGLDRDPATQGFECGQADIVLANHALTDAAEANETAAHLRALLKPSGLLVLVEARPNPVLDFALGLSRRRWLYSDTDLRPNSPLLPAARWAALLRGSGFVETAVLGDDFTAVATPIVLARNAAVNGHAVADPAIESRHWVVLSDAADVHAGGLVQHLKKMQQRVTSVFDGAEFRRLDDGVVQAALSTASDYRRLVGELREELASGVDLVYARGMTRRINDAMLDPLAPQERGSLGLLLLVQALTEARVGGSVRIWVVTKGAIATPLRAELLDPAQAPLWGVVRTLQNERADMAFRLVDISPVDGDDPTLLMLANELLWPGQEDEVVLRGAARYVHRLQPGMPLPEPTDTDSKRAASAAYKVALKSGGRHEGLALAPVAMPSPVPGEVLVRVVAAGLNYRDVLQRVGLLPEEAFEGGFAGPSLGMEFSGEVIAIGEGVAGFKIGDGVFGFAPGAFASHLRVPAGMLFRKPATLGFEAAATLPVAALTAYYSLQHVARLQRGERVLIHGAAGGVGLAAIQYARIVGAEIFATAGTPAKRAFLRRLGVQHVFDSRSLAFADQIRLVTKGEGVDVVLNSLAGEALHKGMGLLRPYGRFVELGKRDFWANTKLGLQPFRNNIQFSGVDVDRLLVDRPALARQLMQELGARINAGEMGALPCRRYPVTRAGEAFRHMQQSRHIGKVVLGFDCAASPEREVPSGGLSLLADATYLVTGGRGGFGLSTAEWLATKGARHLVLIGRSTSTKPEAAEALQRLRDAGVAIREVSLDVADGGAMKGLFEVIGREMPPLRGIVHCAAVIDDAALANMTPERFYAVMRPKVLGALHLDRLTRGMPLDFFVMYSSAVTLFGNPGQTNYMAANLYLEALGAERRAQGLPALVVQWGAIEGVGHLARHAELAKAMSERLGVKMLTPERALARLEAAILGEVGQVALADINWSRLAAMPQLAKSPKYALVRPSPGEGASDGGADAAELKEKLASMPEAQRLQYIEQLVLNHLAGVLRMPPSKLDVHHSLLDLGMDSLMVVELQVAIEQQFGISVSPVELMDVATVAQLVQRVAEKLGVDAAQMAAEAPGGGNGIVIDTMPPEMLDDVLGKLLEPEAEQRATERVTS